MSYNDCRFGLAGKFQTDGTGLWQLTNDGLFKEQGWWLKAEE
jgi:hypothetical protein